MAPARIQANASMSQANTSQKAARAAERSADAATKTYTLGERPFITVKEMKMLLLKPNVLPKGEVLFVNSGRSPAYKVSVVVGTILLPGLLPEQPPSGKFLGNVEFPVAAGGSTLLPMRFGIEFRDQQTIYSLGNSEDVVNDTFKNKQFLYVYGHVTYRDGAGAEHTTRYCGFYSRLPNDTGNVVILTTCTTHNSAN